MTLLSRVGICVVAAGAILPGGTATAITPDATVPGASGFGPVTVIEDTTGDLQPELVVGLSAGDARRLRSRAPSTAVLSGQVK